MAETFTRLTFVVTKEMEQRLADAKKNWFYDCTQSDMIRKLMQAGLEALDEEAEAEKRPAKAG